MPLLKNAFSAPSLDRLKPELVSGKTVFVTGASGGLGIEAARHYARLGARRVILAVRSQSRRDAAKKSILASVTPSPATDSPVTIEGQPQIDVWILDLSSYASVQSFADKVLKDAGSLHIALLNAAVSKIEFCETQDGWDETLQTNLLSTVLLALRLLPKLRESSENANLGTSHLSIVVVRAHTRVKDNVAWLNAPNILQIFNRVDEFTGLGERYMSSKLLLVCATREIAKITSPHDGKVDVIVNYTCPGACGSDLAREWKNNLATRILLYGIQKTIAKTAEQGARTLVLGTLLDASNHGMFLMDSEVVEYV
jgi:retinol dehydrogenase-12